MCYPPVQGRLFTRYSPVRHYPGSLLTEVSIHPVPFDLHGLGTPPAFVLSQDQTLNKSLKKSFDFLFLLVSVLRLSFAYFSCQNLYFFVLCSFQGPFAASSGNLSTLPPYPTSCQGVSCVARDVFAACALHFTAPPQSACIEYQTPLFMSISFFQFLAISYRFLIISKENSRKSAQMLAIYVFCIF